VLCERLADMIATVMQEHGHSTPRAVALALRRQTACDDTTAVHVRTA